MTVIVDTGVLYADHDTDATRHEPARNALESVYDGDYGLPYISDYIYDEAVTLTLKRGNSFIAAKRLGSGCAAMGHIRRRTRCFAFRLLWRFSSGTTTKT